MNANTKAQTEEKYRFLVALLKLSGKVESDYLITEEQVKLLLNYFNVEKTYKILHASMFLEGMEVNNIIRECLSIGLDEEYLPINTETK